MLHAEYSYEYACGVGKHWQTSTPCKHPAAAVWGQEVSYSYGKSLYVKTLGKFNGKWSTKHIWWPGASCSVTAGRDSRNAVTPIGGMGGWTPTLPDKQHICFSNSCPPGKDNENELSAGENLLTVTRREQIPVMKKPRTPGLRFFLDQWLFMFEICISIWLPSQLVRSTLLGWS